MKMDGRRLAFIVEVSEHLEWMQKQMAHGRLDVLDEETSVLLAASAIRQVDLVAPVYGNFFPAIKYPLVRSCIVFRCWEHRNVGHSETSPGLRRF